MGSKKRSIDAAQAARKKAVKALCGSWTRMRIVARHPDSDESPDQTAANDFVDRAEFVGIVSDELPTTCLGFLCPFPSSVCDRCGLAEKEKEEEIAAEAPRESNRDLYYAWFDRYFASYFESEVSFSSVHEAKAYARLGTPMVRGRTRFSAILRLSKKFV